MTINCKHNYKLPEHYRSVIDLPVSHAIIIIKNGPYQRNFFHVGMGR